MDKKIDVVSSILYEDDMKSVENAVMNINDPLMLHIYAFNYNWDDGFSIPRIIVDNAECDMGTALMVFDLAEGYGYFPIIKEVNERVNKEWLDFVSYLYKRIVNSDFKNQNFKYVPELSKVQIYKLKKENPDINEIFVHGTTGEAVELPSL